MKKKVILFSILSVVCVALIIGGIYLTENNDYVCADRLMEAIEEEDIEEVKQIIEKNPDCIDYLPYLMPESYYSLMDIAIMHPLTLACETGNYEIVELLVKNGADVNVSTDLNSPLSITYRTKVDNWYEISTLLIENGADLNYTTSRYGDHVACLQDIAETRYESNEDSGQVYAAFIYALEHCDHSKVDWGRVMQYNVSFDRHKNIKFLLEEGYCTANETAKDGSDYTPLMFAARDSDAAMVELLLSYGADKSMVNEDGMTAYDYAVEKEKTEIISLLES